MNNVIIPYPEKLEEKKKVFSAGGAEKLHILSDFDKTLTTAFHGGKSIPSLISLLRDGNYLNHGYVETAQGLYYKYHPIEIDPKIPLEEKKKAMQEWWTTHFDLLIKLKLNKKDIKKVIESNKANFREGFLEFTNFLKAKKIPLVIMSSSGLGVDGISMCLEKEGRLYKNIHIISNSFLWDENGNAVGIKQPIIHSMNKDETLIQDFPAFQEVKNRKNVLLIGDNPEDIDMIKGFDYDNLMTIGFLNEKVEENTPRYKNAYDIIITNDASMYFVNNLLKDIIK